MIGNTNAITYKEVFPLIKENKLWLGATGFSTDMVFGVPEGTIVPEAYKKKLRKWATLVIIPDLAIRAGLQT